MNIISTREEPTIVRARDLTSESSCVRINDLAMIKVRLNKTRLYILNNKIEAGTKCINKTLRGVVDSHILLIDNM
jgi:hypothetical protein